MDILPLCPYPDGPAKRTASIPLGPCIPPVDSIRDMRALPAPGTSKILAAGYSPTHSSSHVRGELLVGVSQPAPPPPGCSPAIGNSGLQSRNSAYVGTLALMDHDLNLTICL